MVCYGYRVCLVLLSCAYSNTVSWGGAAAAGGDGDGRLSLVDFVRFAACCEKLRSGPKEEEGGGTSNEKYFLVPRTGKSYELEL